MDKKEGKGCCACFQPKMTKAELLLCSFPKSKLCFFFFLKESVERMRSSPSKVVRFFPIKIKQNWQQAVPKPDATREKGKWLQTKLPTQKSTYPKQPPITKRTGYLSHTGDYLTADPKRKRSLRTSPTPIDCKPYSVTRLATLFEPICLEPKGLEPKGYGKAKLASERSGQGDAKVAAEKKLTTPTTPYPTPPITTHRLQAINSLVIRWPIFSKAIAH